MDVTTRVSAGLFDGFEGHRSTTEADLIHAVQNALVVLDTNVLLNLYSFQGTVLDDFFRVFEALGSRIFVPNQVVDEFWRNRRTVLAENQGRHREQPTIEKAFGEIDSAFTKWHQRVVSRNGELPTHVVTSLEKAREAVLGYMAEQNAQANAAHPDTPTHEDRVVNRLAQTLDGRVGPAPAPEQVANLRAEGLARIKAKTPPGYLDADKHPDRAIGDFLVWRQTMDAAVERRMPVLMVTQDQKEDWWADRGTKSMRARSELVSELLAEADQRLLMIRAHDLVRLGQHVGVAVHESTLVEVELAAEEVGSWESDVVVVAAREAYGAYLRTDGYICQEGRYFRDVRYLAFYADQEVKPYVAKILLREDHVPLTEEESSRRLNSDDPQEQQLGEIIRDSINGGSREVGELQQIFVLSGPEDPRTIHLDSGVPNTLTGANGKTVAFTQGQRYVSSEALKVARSTSDLVPPQ